METRFDELEITTNKTVEGTGFAWWAGNARLINLAFPAHQANPVDSIVLLVVISKSSKRVSTW